MKAKDLERHFKKSGKTITENPLDRLDDIVRSLDCRPPGGFTLPEAARKRGVSRAIMRHLMVRLLKAGKAKRHEFPEVRQIYYTLNA